MIRLLPKNDISSSNEKCFAYLTLAYVTTRMFVIYLIIDMLYFIIYIYSNVVRRFVRVIFQNLPRHPIVDVKINKKIHIMLREGAKTHHSCTYCNII